MGAISEGQSVSTLEALPSPGEQEASADSPAPKCLSPKRRLEDTREGGQQLIQTKKRSKSPVHPDTPDIKDRDNCRSSGDHYGTSILISPIGHDLTINCLLRLSRSDYGSVASLNKSFRSLVRSGELYRLRQQLGIAEQWVYFSCNVLEWDAYDPYRGRWMTLPKMPAIDGFMFSDKESVAAGTDLLVFGRELYNFIVLRYSILTHSWTPGIVMNYPRCLFGSASFGEKAIIAGGTDSLGNSLSIAELYDSVTRTWTTLPRMNRARKMCSGVFMDGKFYVIGGMANHTQVLTCGEEYELGTDSWRLIPNMSAGLNCPSGAPPLVAVVKNELYAADYGENVIKKYDKKNNIWITLGCLPERSASMNGWGLAFRGCGDRLIVIGGPKVSGGGLIEVNSWAPKEGLPEWNLVARRHSGNFVYNCAIMSC